MDADPDRAADLVRRCRHGAGRDLRRARRRARSSWRSPISRRASARIRPAWRWGAAHPARMAHADPRRPAVAGVAVQHRRPRAAATAPPSTSATTGCATSASPFASTHAASYRGLYDLADLDRSRFVATTGQSGNPLSPHYRDLTALWAAGATVPMSRAAGAYAGRRDRAAEPGARSLSEPRAAR